MRDAQTRILGVVRLLCTSDHQWREARAQVTTALNGVRSAAAEADEAPPSREP